MAGAGVLVEVLARSGASDHHGAMEVGSATAPVPAKPADLMNHAILRFFGNLF
jgi:hypothetical protein